MGQIDLEMAVFPHGTQGDFHIKDEQSLWIIWVSVQEETSTKLKMALTLLTCEESKLYRHLSKPRINKMTCIFQVVKSMCWLDNHCYEMVGITDTAQGME
jgi:hypothetical protein